MYSLACHWITFINNYLDSIVDLINLLASCVIERGKDVFQNILHGSK